MAGVFPGRLSQHGPGPGQDPLVEPGLALHRERLPIGPESGGGEQAEHKARQNMGRADTYRSHGRIVAGQATQEMRQGLGLETPCAHCPAPTVLRACRRPSAPATPSSAARSYQSFAFSALGLEKGELAADQWSGS